MDKLEDLGVDGNTIIFFFNDHGVEYGGKGGLYEHGSKSISIAWRKNGFPMTGHNSDALLSNVDFAPTILDYAGIVPPLGSLDGKSYRPILEGDVDEIRKSVFIEFGCARGVIMDGYKYISIRWPDSSYNSLFSDPEGNDLGWGSLKVYSTGDMEYNVRTNFPEYYDDDQLYDLNARISKIHPKSGSTVSEDEQVNLAIGPAYATRLQAMKDELQTYLDTLPGPFSEFKSAQEEHWPGSLIELR
jgi:arylsulfatase A-like enzyme